MNDELISVLMCTYKENTDYLRLAIESILKQTYKNIELIIIVDNPNNNEHSKLIDEYIKIDKRIKKYINSQNIGLPNSLNRGLSLANGAIIARIDADDIALPSRLEEEFLFLKENPEYSVVSVNKKIIDGSGEVISTASDLPHSFKVTKKAMMFVNIVLHPGSMYYKEVVQKLGGYRNIPNAEDYDLWLRAFSSGYQIGFLDKPLMLYRMDGNNITSRNSLKMWCTHKYVRRLYDERQKNNSDSYSLENLEGFLKKCKCNMRENVERFNTGTKYFHKARYELSNKNYTKALICFVRAITSHKEMIPFIVNSFRYKCVMIDNIGETK